MEEEYGDTIDYSGPAVDDEPVPVVGPEPEVFDESNPLIRPEPKAEDDPDEEARLAAEYEAANANNPRINEVPVQPNPQPGPYEVAWQQYYAPFNIAAGSGGSRAPAPENIPMRGRDDTPYDYGHTGGEHQTGYPGWNHGGGDVWWRDCNRRIYYPRYAKWNPRDHRERTMQVDPIGEQAATSNETMDR